MKTTRPLVSAHWLYKNIHTPNLIIFDTSMPKVTEAKKESTLERKNIINALFLDIKKVFSEPNAPFPNTLLSPEKFEKKAQEMGVFKDSMIVVYDDIGIYSSARVWWMFTSMGFHNIFVLDGGLPAWLKEDYPIEKNFKSIEKVKKGNFKSKFEPTFFCDKNSVLKAITNTKQVLLDARNNDRFLAKVAEPRKNLRSGHIPTAKNLPYSELLEDGKMKSLQEIQKKFATFEVENKEIIFSCGSGVTACILALGATIAGYKKLSVYDGSWTEWGSLQGLPIEI